MGERTELRTTSLYSTAELRIKQEKEDQIGDKRKN